MNALSIVGGIIGSIGGLWMLVAHLNRLWRVAAALAPADPLRKRCLRLLVMAGVLTLNAFMMTAVVLLEGSGVITDPSGPTSLGWIIFISLAMAGGTGLQAAELLRAAERAREAT